MKIPVRLVLCVLMVSGALAQGQYALQISNTFPPPEDIRKPDLTISGESTKPIAAIAYNPNGRFLAVAGNDNTIRVYDARPGDRLTADLAQTLTGPTAQDPAIGRIMAIAFSATNTLVSVSFDQTAKIWDVSSGKLLHRADLNIGKLLIPAIAPGNQPLLAGGTLNRVRLWNYQTGELLQTFEVNDSNVAALAFTPDGKLLVIGTTKGVIRVMDVAAWKMTRTMDLDTPVYSLAATTNHILVGYGDGTLALLNMGDQDSIPEMKKHSGAINAVAFSPNGDRFASASADKTVKVWDTGAMKAICSLEGHSGEALSVAFSPNGQKIASANAVGTVNVWTVPVPQSHP